MEYFNENSYKSTLKMIFFKAVSDIFPLAKVEISHTLTKGLFGLIHKEEEVSKEDVELIKKKMDEIIATDFPINLITTNVEDLRKKAKSIKREDIVRTIRSTGWIYIKEFELDGYHDFLYDSTYPSTKYVYLYDLIEYNGGFILRFPIKDNPNVLPPYENTPKLAAIQRECETWGEVMDVSYIGSLNEKTIDGSIKDVIRISETLHDIKISKIADEIIRRPELELVTIAGPSSSGKTTFGKRLMMFLKANKILPILISLDNYYLGRNNVPLDEHGEKDFETIDALDLKLLNENLVDLIAGKEVEIPEYDFKTGMRKSEGTKMKVPKNGIIIIEGIHGLNEKLTSAIKRENKFKIYISCLTQLNIDMHNRIPTSEVRKIRRIVRDSLSRGTSAENTLKMWDSVRRGEEKYIFKYQEDADIMFDSNLVYELGVLKKHAMRELIKVQIESKYYEEAKRMLRFLYCFVDIEEKYVPDTSLLKEFIGGSYFYNY